MGEAKLKEDRRRQQATKIVDAFEEHIRRLIYEAEQSMKGYNVRPDYISESRNDLIAVLIAPPPR